MDSINHSRNKLLRLFPAPLEPVALEGLYLNQELHRLGTRSQPFVYTNFIASLDGRISLEHPRKRTRIVPDTIANPRDWRLFQELAAQADALLTSGRYIRQLAQNVAQDILPVSEKPEYADLIQWRQSQGLAPQPAIVVISASLNIPIPEILLNANRPIYVATGSEADPLRVQELKAKGIQVIVAGKGLRVQGKTLIAALGQEGFTTLYAIAGPEVLKTLLADQSLNRLYLTHALRILGGESFDTLLEGERLNPVADFNLHSLYYDTAAEGEPSQVFAIYEPAANAAKISS
ncbi:bifunctional deaminase-reductase domain protein [Nitrosococcus halophilus Nc 4]|uniref:Bifunctional deaminase-reductase domain protein n=1 Tax=Nitrosococcus halophilus (strain Nc4) TaxID=472759 RepID=D5BZQ2_NITHN|nr:dihydrofolate reductase family protein [Nitrosococcus halophilus]ADE14347.1 bifunctional deaminase-reductase domain protein [Nitrosococcus halophilus Nc 4]